MKLRLLTIAAVLLGGMTLACHHHRRPEAYVPPPPSQPFRTFVDLKAGWRLKVVVPRPGAPAAEQTRDAELSNYELNHYTVRARSGGGVLIEFLDSSVYTNGKPEAQAGPSLALLTAMERASYFRLVYLVRETHGDHDLALVSATTPAALEEQTRAVSERGECAPGGCWWVPAGVRITPEELRKVRHKRVWMPAR